MEERLSALFELKIATRDESRNGEADERRDRKAESGNGEAD